MRTLWSDSPAPALVARARDAEAAEAAAWADSYQAVADIDTELGAAAARIGDATVFGVRTMPMGLFGRVIGLGLTRPATPALLDEIRAWYRDAGISGAWFQASPAAQPDGLGGVLTGAGLHAIELQWGKFVRGAEPAPEVDCDLDVREVGADDRDDFASATIVGFGLPPALAIWPRTLPGRDGWRCYVAYHGREPAACGAAFRHGDTVFIGFGACRPEYRGRGGQSALLARRIADGIAAGARGFTTETGASDPPGGSWRNIARAGFELLYLRPNWTAPTAD